MVKYIKLQFYNKNEKRKKVEKMRLSGNEYIISKIGKYSYNRLFSGYDYENQAWVKNGKYVRCGHPENMACNCYGKIHEGEETLPVLGKI